MPPYPSASQAADTVLSRIAGTEPAVLDLAYVGAMRQPRPTGRHRQFTHKDDTPLNFHFGGRIAAFVKEDGVQGHTVVDPPRRPQARFHGLAQRARPRPKQPARGKITHV